MSLEINRIHQGDARELLPSIAPESVAVSLWSPPYFVGKEYERYLVDFNDWKGLLSKIITLHEPILKPGGFLVINIADILCFPDESIPRYQAMTVSRHRSSVTKEDVLRAKAEHPNFNRKQLAKLLGCSEQTVDRRLNGNNIRGGKYATQTRVQLAGDVLVDAAAQAGLPLYDRRIWVKDAAWENSRWASMSYRSVDEFEYIYFFWKPGITKVDRARLAPNEWSEWGSRGVWKFPSVRSNDDHEAKFPIELPRRVIRLLTDPGDTVLDCFIGSGTTAVSAIQEGRNFIGIELDEKYAASAARACQTEMRKGRTVIKPESKNNQSTREETQTGLFKKAI